VKNVITLTGTEPGSFTFNANALFLIHRKPQLMSILVLEQMILKCHQKGLDQEWAITFT